ncbi:MAG: S8 family peptidase [Thermodesulfobacteriota bacterium]|nr:S8 family peptidase [Thermodesulfobacteriota bacterium]
MYRYASINKIFIISICILFAISAVCYGGRNYGGSIVNKRLGEKSFYLSICDGLVSLDAQEADLRQILTEISNRTKVVIEIAPSVKDKITTSFRSLPLDKALKKITGNWAMVFLKEKDQNVEQLSKVVILAGSQNPVHTQAKSKTNNLNLFKALPANPAKSAAPTAETGFQKRLSTPLTIINEKTGIKSNVVPNELIVCFKKGLSKKEILSLVTATGTTVKAYIKALNYYVLSLPPDFSVNDALRWYRRQGVVDQAEPNYLIPLKTIPNDLDFSRQWSLHNIGQTGGTDDADIDALEAWDIEHGKPEVIIAVIDTGVDYTHEDLAANIWQNTGEIPDNGIDDEGNGYIDDVIGWDFVDSFGGAADEDFLTPDNDPMDRHGHGTHVAGIAGAVANNSVGIVGVAWNCKIMPVRAGYKTSSGDGVLESDDAAQAIIYSAENGAKVINLSWGDYQKSNLIEEAMTYATNHGTLVCAAAGNENSNSLIYPAASENTAVLAIGATDSHDLKASFSNYGAWAWVDVSAPGVNIYSTFLNNAYRQMSGTSMAAPHVAGVAALLFSYFPDISPIEAKTRIMRSVDVLADLSEKNSVSGRINVYSALTASHDHRPSRWLA